MKPWNQIIQKQIWNPIKKSCITPIQSIKKRYIPLLAIYFTYGLSGFSAVALSFWQKESLGLSAEQLISISVWVTIPWVLKMIFGQMIDSVPLWGSQRKSYIYIGASLMAMGMILLAGLAGKEPLIMSLGTPYQLYLISSLLTAFGFVIQDVVADTMSTEIIERTEIKNKKKVPRPDQDIQAELTMIQVLGRLSLIGATFVVGYAGGYFAGIFKPETIFWSMLILPVISCISVFFINITPPKKEDIQPLNKKIMAGGIAFAILSLTFAVIDIPYSQEILFVLSGLLLSGVLFILLKKTPSEIKQKILITLGIIFLYRLFALSSVGPGVQWWSIDVLKFDQEFFGILQQISATMTILLLWFGADLIAKKSVRSIFLFLLFFGLGIALPEILVYYNVHEIFALEPRTIFLFDTALESPLTQISMIPMLALIAFYAPAGNRGTWFAVSASLMNLALTGGAILTKYLNKIYVIQQAIYSETGELIQAYDYSQLGHLMIVKTVIAFSIPFIAIYFFLKKTPTQKKAIL